MAFDFSTLITDRGPGTFYNVSDLNRVGEAVRYLAERFTNYGYAVSVAPKTNWAENDVPIRRQLETYRRNIVELRRQLTVMQSTPKTPETMLFLDYLKANNIEQILFDLDELLTKSREFQLFSGELYAGEV